MNELTVNLKLNQELAMEFCACIDFVVILWGNLRLLKWKKFLWNCIIFLRHFNPATIIGSSSFINGREGSSFRNILQKQCGLDFSHKKGGAGKIGGLFWKNEGFQIFSSILTLSTVMFLSVCVCVCVCVCSLALFLSFFFAFPEKDLVLFNLMHK